VRGSATATAKKFNFKGSGNFTELKAIILEDFNIEVEQQYGATPFRNDFGLPIWQASQLEVGKMNGEARHREPE
jgi:hypothetical protein